MLASRVAFVDSTNNSRPRRHHLPPRQSFSHKLPLSSCKSQPICTLSLASAKAGFIDGVTTTSVIPFPSETESEPDPTAFLHIQTRRKRLCQPVLVVPKSAASSSSSQPPRKRPRLHKAPKLKTSTKSSPLSSPSSSVRDKGASPLSTPELRFMAVLQRSVACGVLDRQRKKNAYVDTHVREEWEATLAFEKQDRELACRLRRFLLEQGVREHDVVDVEREDFGVDLDVEMEVDTDNAASSRRENMPSSSAASVDMDIDVEPSTSRTSLSHILNPIPSLSSKRCVPHHSPSPSPSPPPPRTLSPSQLVASLTIRHRTRPRVSLRSGEVQTRSSPVSPLARLEVTER